MNNYLIEYEILNYEKYNKRLQTIVNNSNNKFKVTKHDNLGKTSCGFDIEHYSIGHGPIHITYLAGAHGNEIIGVDYVTQLMQNLALGNGTFSNFDENLFTIDFIPCQNPEGFYTTTYALDSVLKNKSDLELEKFCKKYWSQYRQDDKNVITLNNIIKNFCVDHNLENINYKLNLLFWNIYREKSLTLKSLKEFLRNYTNVPKEQIEIYINDTWKKNFDDIEVINNEKLHFTQFDNITIDCIPEIDESHIKLKNKIKKIYENGDFKYNTLINFIPNADSVNLNENNEYYFNSLKNQIENEGKVYGSLRNNHLIKSIPGPLGLPSISMDKEFEYAEENQALLNFLEKLSQDKLYFALINCHGTGGLLYLYPEENVDNLKLEERDFKFYINNRISTEYTNSIGNTYKKYTGEFSPYKTMGHPDKITGFGDVLRKKYIASFILELSKMGGNPIAPYGDRLGNYNLTMISNMESTTVLLETIKNLKHLYDTTYTITYDSDDKVKYKIK